MAQTGDLARRIEDLEKEVERLKSQILQGKTVSHRNTVSLRGTATTELSNEELDSAIEESKSALADG